MNSRQYRHISHSFRKQIKTHMEVSFVLKKKPYISGYFTIGDIVENNFAASMKEFTFFISQLNNLISDEKGN
jgi:hypothetical protein